MENQDGRATDEVRSMGECYGGWWCGVSFGSAAVGSNQYARRRMRFCEAVAAGWLGTFVLTPELLDCPGGSRCLGWNDDEEAIARGVAQKAGIATETATGIVRATPRLPPGVAHVSVGIHESPDVLLSYAQPQTVMRILRAWQSRHGGFFVTETSAFMSVCGAVAVRAHLTGGICLSFGCPDSREHGAIGSDRLVIGLPVAEARTLLDPRPASASGTARGEIKADLWNARK